MVLKSVDVSMKVLGVPKSEGESLVGDSDLVRSIQLYVSAQVHLLSEYTDQPYEPAFLSGPVISLLQASASVPRPLYHAYLLVHGCAARNH